MSAEPKTYEDGIKEGTDNERVRLMTLILKEQQVMSAEYRNTIKHTGGLLTQSMSYAYSKAFNDIFKLINKGLKNEKSVQEKAQVS